MIDPIVSSLSFQGNALKLRAERQAQLASNIANADTPGYKAKDIDFARSLEAATRPGAAGISGKAAIAQPRAGAVANADGNTVDMDVERQAFLDNALHYDATLRFLNGRIRTLLSAIQGQ